MSKSHRWNRFNISLAFFALTAAAAATPHRAVAQAAQSAPVTAGPRLRPERAPLALTFRGERVNSAAPAAHRRTTIQISLLAVVVGIILLVILL